jgi:hypothetical protein
VYDGGNGSYDCEKDLYTWERTKGWGRESHAWVGIRIELQEKVKNRGLGSLDHNMMPLLERHFHMTRQF